MLTSGMESPQKTAFAAFALLIAVCVLVAAPHGRAQEPASTAGRRRAPHRRRAHIMDRLNAMMAGGPSAWTPEQIATMAKLRDAAMKDSYAINELRHLTDNIGTLAERRSAGTAGGPGSGRSRCARLAAEVTLEKAMVPHWVRGAGDGPKVDSWPGMTPGTQQKIVLTALGGSVATPADGLTAQVVVVDNWDQLRGAGDRARSRARFCSSTIRSTRSWPHVGNGLHGVCGRRGVSRRRAPLRGQLLGAVAVLVRSVGGDGLPAAAHRA